MLNEFDNGFLNGGWIDPAVKFLVGFGYDPESYISTAKLTPSPYVTQALIEAKVGGLIRLVEACDDSVPPIGNLNPTIGPAIANIPNPAYLTYLAVIQTVVTEVNGYLSTVYPTPLAQTGTVAILKVTAVTATGAVSGLSIIAPGNYCTAPAVDQFPAYLRHLDPNANECFWGWNWQHCQTGTGLELTVAYAGVTYSDESGQVLQAQTVIGTPIVVAGGTGYQCGDLLVLTGGSSFVPAKVRQGTLDLICHTLYKRRLAPDEKNPFSTLAAMWRKTFTAIGNTEEPLDGTYKRFYSAAMSWNTASVLYGANSR